MISFFNFIFYYFSCRFSAGIGHNDSFSAISHHLFKVQSAPFWPPRTPPKWSRWRSKARMIISSKHIYSHPLWSCSFFYLNKCFNHLNIQILLYQNVCTLNIVWFVILFKIKFKQGHFFLYLFIFIYISYVPFFLAGFKSSYVSGRRTTSHDCCAQLRSTWRLFQFSETGSICWCESSCCDATMYRNFTVNYLKKYVCLFF